jgi:uncharacterized protein (TIGR03083 family)
VRVPGAIQALKLECALVSETALALSEEEFSRPTRCPAWNVKELVAHMHRDIERIVVSMAVEVSGRPDVDAVTYWRSYDPVGDAPTMADRSKARADSYRTGLEVAIVWDDLWRHALDLVEGEPPSRPFATWGPVMLLEEFLKTRVVEITVHGMDLADALGRDPWPTSEGLDTTIEILRGSLGGQPVGELEWGPMTFVEKGTGRQPLSDVERRTLGPLAARFPLLA